VPAEQAAKGAICRIIFAIKSLKRVSEKKLSCAKNSYAQNRPLNN
jgi:hypothetical protein